MSGLINFQSVQKLRFFLAGVFPSLVRAPSPDEPSVRLLSKFPKLDALWTRVMQSAVGVHFTRLTATFALGNYAQDQLDIRKIPEEGRVVLRAPILIAGLLCLLLPLAIAWVWPPVAAEPITGVAGPPVAGWSVVLWIVAYALGWACLLAGTALASRLTFVLSMALFVYFTIGAVALLPKSWWSVAVSLQVTLALLYAEVHAPRGRASLVSGALTSVVVGAGLAFFTMVTIPTAPWYRGRILVSTAWIGTLAGLVLWGVGVWLRSRTVDRAPWWKRLDSAVFTFSCLSLVTLVSGTVRGGLTVPATGINAFAIQMTGYLWPLYYFIGIGVVFKVLRQTKAVHAAVQELVPAASFLPVSFVILVLATVIPWVEPILLRPDFPWPWGVHSGAEWIYNATTTLWDSQLFRMSAESMKWFTAAALAIAVYAAARGRLTSGNMAGTLFAVFLAWLAALEYHFEFTGFARTPRNSALSLFVFSVFVLWLTHKTTLKFLTGGSRWWPPLARVATYGAGLMFVLLPVHARAALHSRNLTNEIFLYLFFGVVNFGAPYYLFVYATKRFRKLPLTAPQLLGIFCIGALLSVPLTLADKAVLAGGWADAWQYAGQQADAVMQGTPLAREQDFFPITWTIFRGLIVMALLGSVIAIVRLRQRTQESWRATVVFIAIAFASGLACFSNRSVEVPLLSNRIVQLITPVRPSFVVDAGLVVRQLMYLLPALALSATVTRVTSRLRLVVGVVAAVALHVLIGLVWPEREAWLRSTGAYGAASALMIMAFVVFAGAVRDRLDDLLESVGGRAGTEGNVVSSGQLVTWPELRQVSLVILLFSLCVTTYFGYRSRMLVRAGSAGVPVPAHWKRSINGTDSSHYYVSRSFTGIAPRLFLGIREAGDSVSADFQAVAAQAASEILGFKPVALKSWDEYRHGAMALSFTFQPDSADAESLAAGTLLLAPLAEGKQLAAWVTYSSNDLGREWDLARIVQATVMGGRDTHSP